MNSMLDEMLEKAKQRLDKMSDAEKEEMHRQQREGYARAETSWPKPKFKYVNGVKVYNSYEDYCNG